MSKLSIGELLDSPVNVKTRALKPRKCGKKKLEGGSKAGEWLKKAGQYIKDKKLISKGLKAVSPFLGAYGGIASVAGTIADTAGYGISVPGGGLTVPGGCKCAVGCKCGQQFTQPHMRSGVTQPTHPRHMKLQKGTGLASTGSGLTLAGDKYRPLRRERVIPADCVEEVSGSGRIIGNRTF